MIKHNVTVLSSLTEQWPDKHRRPTCKDNAWALAKHAYRSTACGQFLRLLVEASDIHVSPHCLDSCICLPGLSSCRHFPLSMSPPKFMGTRMRMGRYICISLLKLIQLHVAFTLASFPATTDRNHQILLN